MTSSCRFDEREDLVRTNDLLEYALQEKSPGDPSDHWVFAKRKITDSGNRLAMILFEGLSSH